MILIAVHREEQSKHIVASGKKDLLQFVIPEKSLRKVFI